MPAWRAARPAWPAPPHSIGCAKPTLLPERSHSLSVSLSADALCASLCSYTRHSSGPLASPTHQHMPRAESQLHAPSARHTCRAAHRHVPPCGRPVASARPDPNNACRTALDLPRQIEELEKKLEAERQCAPHPAVPRACVPGGAGLRRSTPSPPRPAPARAGPPPPTRDPPSCTSAPLAHLNPAGRAQEAAGGRDAAH